MAVAGRPNVGKSSLVNALCGGKVAIVSDNPQTTRRRIFGVANWPDWQLVLADLPPEVQVAELVREKALALTKDEIPHAVSAEVEELGEKSVRVVLYVETESQKQILIGKGGAVVKEIGVRARPEIELLLGHKVFLDLHVKARPHWRRDEAMLARLGI